MAKSVTIGARGSFTATHICAEPEAHEHTWHVEAAFTVAPRTDVRCYQAMLNALLSSWQGKPLPEALEWAEDLAAAVGQLVNCVRVRVDRGDTFAEWPAL